MSEEAFNSDINAILKSCASINATLDKMIEDEKKQNEEIRQLAEKIKGQS